jgi:hypothetical protein
MKHYQFGQPFSIDCQSSHHISVPPQDPIVVDLIFGHETVPIWSLQWRPNTKIEVDLTVIITDIRIVNLCHRKAGKSM